MKKKVTDASEHLAQLEDKERDLEERIKKNHDDHSEYH